MIKDKVKKKKKSYDQKDHKKIRALYGSRPSVLIFNDDK